MKVLFIHHGSLNGGAPLSMNYTMNALKPYGYKFTVGLVSYTQDSINFFEKSDNEVINLSWIKIQTLYSAFDKPIYNRYSFKEWFSVQINREKIKKQIKAIFSDGNYDLMHLNSVVLSPIVEILLELDIPFVWHIREAAPKKNRDFRFNKIVKLMQKAENLIFLSEDEQQSWLGNSKHGIVVNNFVDFKTFNTKNIDVSNVKNKYNVNSGEFILLFLGGFKPHKGPDLLLKALDILVNKKGYKNIKCIMPDTIKNKKSSLKLIIKQTVKQILFFYKKQKDFDKEMFNYIDRYNLKDNCILLPFNPYTQELFAICDIVLFPATVPHFARPIIEAGAMRKPVIATNLPILNNLVINGKTGFLTELNSQSIADSIEKLYNNSELSNKMGKNAELMAKEKYNADKQILMIHKMYKKAIN